MYVVLVWVVGSNQLHVDLHVCYVVNPELHAFLALIVGGIIIVNSQNTGS